MPNSEHGQTIILVALMLIVLVAFVGLGTDVSLVYSAQAHLQRAIDAAALAAANKLPDQTEASLAAYEFTRLHGYDFSPSGDPLQISYPVENPPRKLAVVTGTVDVDLAFLRVVGWRHTPVTASAEGESAPLDVYLVLDLSESMAYDTVRPANWNSICASTTCPFCPDWTACSSYYCNRHSPRNCNPLDAHIKPSAKFFVDQLDSRYDRVGVIRYDRFGYVPPTQSMILTGDFAAVKTAINNLDVFQRYMQGGQQVYLSTNVGDGLLVANNLMSQPPANGGGRADSVWAIVLLTDGRANLYRNCPGCPDDCSGTACQRLYGYTPPCPEAENWARANAWSSWNNHKIVIYTIAYGDMFFDYPQYQRLMIDIADITDNGVLDGATDNFWAVPDEAGLRQALAEIAERIYTRLVR